MKKQEIIANMRRRFMQQQNENAPPAVKLSDARIKQKAIEEGLPEVEVSGLFDSIKAEAVDFMSGGSSGKSSPKQQHQATIGGGGREKAEASISAAPHPQVEPGKVVFDYQHPTDMFGRELTLEEMTTKQRLELEVACAAWIDSMEPQVLADGDIDGDTQQRFRALHKAGVLTRPQIAEKLQLAPQVAANMENEWRAEVYTASKWRGIYRTTEKILPRSQFVSARAYQSPTGLHANPM